MREFLGDVETGHKADPMQQAREKMRSPRIRRFYREAASIAVAEGYAVQLDGRAVMTPARRALVAPAAAIGAAIAAEWQAQGEEIDPASMPLTRLANSILDGVAVVPDQVRTEVLKYLATDLLCYRADGPEELIARQTRHWNPVLRWAEQASGGRLILSEGVMHVAQPPEALARLAHLVPDAIWPLGAVHVLTTLTGSALLALAAHEGAFAAESLWQAANVDEDWNVQQWGDDPLAQEKRAGRRRDFDAAMQVLDAVRAERSTTG